MHLLRQLIFFIFANVHVGLAAIGPDHLSRHVLHERTMQNVATHWVASRRMDPGIIIPMRIGLTQRNLDNLESMVMNVSHPESPWYGRHLAPSELIATFSPRPETVAAVVDWLTASGISHERLQFSPDGGWIHVHASIAEAQELLKSEYHIYTNPLGEQKFGCPEYSIPAHVKEHIDIITPTVHYRSLPQSDIHHDSIKAAASNKGLLKSHENSLENCDKEITIDCIRALYNFNYKPVSQKKNTLAIVEMSPNSFVGSDLDQFFGNFSPLLIGKRPEIVLIDGAVIQTTQRGLHFNGESNLDLELAMTLTDSYPSIILLQTGDMVQESSDNNWLDAIDGSYCTTLGGDDPSIDGTYPNPLVGGFNGPPDCGTTEIPSVISISYSDDESHFTPFYANRQCAEFGKLALMGTTILYSSGDAGVGGLRGCLNEDHISVDNGTIFSPEFPMGCPYVTAVGATGINFGSSVYEPETACPWTGGGFSNFYEMPSYQQDAVKNYLQKHHPPYTDGQFNNSGVARAYPDISANGQNVVAIVNDQFQHANGTSPSTPIIASMIAMINDARLAAGKKSVGFINPAIYSSKFSDAFNDIVSGNNPGCNTPGFSAVPGWDPITGLGTPKFDKLLKAFMDLP